MNDVRAKHHALVAPLAELLKVAPDDVHRTLTTRGLSYSVDSKGEIIVTPVRRLDAYNFEDLQDVWGYLPITERLYYESQVHTGDESAMLNEYKLAALVLYREFIEWSRTPDNSPPLALVYEPQKARTMVLDGGYLYRIGYRAYISRAYPSYEAYKLPDDREWLYTDEVEHHLPVDKSWQYYTTRGLYRLDNVATDTTTLNDVLTLAEAAEIFDVDAGTIRVSIHKGYVAARKSGGTWLIARADAERRWSKRK